MRSKLPRHVINSINDFREHFCKLNPKTSPLKDFIYERHTSKYFEYYFRPLNIKLNKVDVKKSDLHVEKICRIFGIKIPNKKIIFVKVKDRIEIEKVCGFTTNGIAGHTMDHGFVLSIFSYHPHETTHALIEFYFSKSNTFFKEGLATLYGWDNELFHGRDIKEQSKEIIQKYKIKIKDIFCDDNFYKYKCKEIYPVAASFMKYIREQYNLTKLKSTYKNIKRTNSAEKNVLILEKALNKKINTIQGGFEKWLMKD